MFQLIYSCVFVLSTLHFCSFSMLRKLTNVFLRGASTSIRNRSSMVKNAGRRLASMKTVTVEASFAKEDALSVQKFFLLNQGIDPNKAFLRAFHCPPNDEGMVIDEIYYLPHGEYLVLVDPLLHAVRMNKGLAVIKKLVEERDDCDVNCNIVDYVHGYGGIRDVFLCPTPLFWAFLHGNYEVAEFLISRGARMDVKNVHGKTPEDMAKDLNSLACWKRAKKEIQV